MNWLYLVGSKVTSFADYFWAIANASWPLVAGIAVAVGTSVLYLHSKNGEETVAKVLKNLKAIYIQMFLKKLNDKLQDPDFLQWQINALRIIYGGRVVCHNAKYLPVAIFPANEAVAKKWFDDGYNTASLGALTGTAIEHHPPQLSSSQRKFWRMTWVTIKRPNLPGFFLKRLRLDGNQFIGFDAGVCRYKDSIICNHVLLYELYCAYIADQSPIGADWKTRLPHLANIFADRTALEVICEPSRSLPVISVQAIIVYRDYTEQGAPWKFRYMVRKSGIASYVGFRQIPPSGGFEYFGSKTSKFADIKTRFNIKHAIFREALEELFGHSELESFTVGYDPADLHKYFEVKSFATKPKDPNKNSHCGIHFLGVAVTLAALIHNLSFLIVVDDEEFAAIPTKRSEESDGFEIELITQLENVIIDHPQVTPDSLGLAVLLKRSGLLKNFGIPPKPSPSSTDGV